MDEILYCLCRHCVSVMDGWYPYPATLIASILGLNVAKVRCHLKKLKQQGIVESIHNGGIDDSGNVWCCWGWTITDKAYSTSEYKLAEKEERKIYKECFSIDL